MKYPEFLKKGDTIGFAAPSFGCATEPYRSAFDSALRKLRSKGYQTVLGPNCYAGDGIGISSSPESCGRELTEVYCGNYGDCAAVIACGGGELMCETMDYVDFERIRASKPRWYTGFSDNTNFVFLLTTLCDTAAIYGPCAPAYGMRRWHRSLRDCMDLLTGRKLSVSTYGRWERESMKNEDNPFEPYNCTEKTRLKIYAPEVAARLGAECFAAQEDIPAAAGVTGEDLLSETDGGRDAHADRTAEFAAYRDRVWKESAEAGIEMRGRLLGGCLDVLDLLCGTRYDRMREFQEKYAEDGIIWFLEACDLNVFSMRRSMWKLERAGWFDTAKGFLIGRPYHFDEPMMGLDQYDAFLEYAARHDVPVVMDADIGHLPPMMPLISGSLAQVHAAGNTVRVDMELA